MSRTSVAEQSYGNFSNYRSLKAKHTRKSLKRRRQVGLLEENVYWRLQTEWIKP